MSFICHSSINLLELAREFIFVFSFFERLKRRGVGNCLAPSAGLGGVGAAMTALFDEQSLAIVAVLFICTCTYIKMKAPTLLNTREG